LLVSEGAGVVDGGLLTGNKGKKHETKNDNKLSAST
jgi:hypothetical protein